MFRDVLSKSVSTSRLFRMFHISRAATMATAPHNSTITIPRGPVTAEAMFYKPPEDGSAPFSYVGNPPPGVPARNYGDDMHPILISDLRGSETKFNLDDNAFQVLQGIQSEEKDFNDDEHINRVYFPEVEKLLLEHVPGAYSVHLFDYTIRRSSPDAYRAPVNRVHVDQTAKSASDRVRLHVPEQAHKLLQGRYRIINLWRPINGPVFANPLGLVDAPTVSDTDLVAIRKIYPNRNGETAGVKYNPKHEWHYLSGMTNEERLLIKCFDSDEKVGKGGRAPHSAFKDPRTPAEAPGRESIEVRALVFG